MGDVLLFRIFFFKRKTAYEMRISDWSSDVCSSDLVPRSTPASGAASFPGLSILELLFRPGTAVRLTGGSLSASRMLPRSASSPRPRARERGPAGRSEEHTSELQSLMRISYAVFCLQKKNTNTTQHTITHRAPHE